ncbi:MAG: hypothetical protein KF696_13750 [Planctomycetes bacterium]|nr:hypothetical protein [Planctomycetota bacterium]MCW8137062.1 hypothetical protein [Planctomycetota bacterium]
MNLLNKLLGKKDPPPAKAAAVPVPVPAPAAPVDPEAAALQNGDTPGNGSELPGNATALGKKGLLKRFESNIRRKVDSYVDNKADELLDDATRRAEEFRQETLDAVRDQAMELLDVTEKRIDEKMVEIEQMLEKRLEAELKMRLRAMFWTLAFVLIMALVSLGYVWFKQQSGLQNANSPAAETAK